MILTLYEQIVIIIKFIILGIFVSLMMDIIDVFNFRKKVRNIIIQFMYWALVTYTVCEAVLVISKGYLPLYTFLFFICGYLIYRKLLKKQFVLTLTKIKETTIKNKKHLFSFFYSRPVIIAIIKLARKIKFFVKKLLKKIFKRRKKPREKEVENIDKKLVES